MNHSPTPPATRLLALSAVLAACTGLNSLAVDAKPPAAASTVDMKIPAWTPTRGHARPLVAIIGDNAGTELTDFVIPYGVLKRAGVETFALATHAGPFRFRPALSAQLDGTTAEFDAEHPEGADYVVVPEVSNRTDPVLLDWIRAQAGKGATLVGICDGTIVLAHAGLLKGKWATAHWASESQRQQAFPNVHWVRNARYVVDTNLVSSSGISAAMPTSIALVEAISGGDRAAALARELGVVDWSPRHDSEAFRPRYGNLGAFAVKLVVNPYLRGTQTIGVPLVDDIDEIALAVTADAYARTGRSKVMALSPASPTVTSRNGLVFIADDIVRHGSVDVVLPPIAIEPVAKAFDAALAGIEARYGRRTAYGVALDFEYPDYIP